MWSVTWRTKTDFNGKKTTYNYDTLNRLLTGSWRSRRSERGTQSEFGFRASQE